MPSFPPKKLKSITYLDRECMSNQMRILRRQKSREYSRKGRSEKFLKMQKEFLDLKNANSIKYFEEIEELKKCNLGQFFKKIKQIGARQGEIVNKTFQLPSHSEQNLSTEESAEIIAKHFSSISKEYPPVDAEKLPSRIKDKIFHPDVNIIAPKVQDFQVYEMLKKRKIKCNSVPRHSIHFEERVSP